MEILRKSMLNLMQVLDKYSDKYPPPEPLSPTLEHYGFRRVPIVQGMLKYMPEAMDIHFDERLHISPELDFFYRHCEIICDTCTDTVNLPDFMHSPGYATIKIGQLFTLFHPEERLAEFQWGWRWRLRYHESCEKEPEENPDWNPDWLVVAYNILCDAVIVDTGKEKSPVMIASHDDCIPHPAANSFAEFLDYISILIELEHGKYSGNKWDEEAGDYIEGFLDDAKEVLGNVNSDSRQVENLINYLYRRDLI